MTGTVSPAVPTIGDPNSTEDADTRSGIITLRDALNAVLTSANTLDGAQIAAGTVPSTAFADNTLALSKLVNQTAGKVLIANASGVVTGTTLSGDVTVTSGGVTAIGTDKVTAPMIAPGAVGTSEIADASIADGDLVNQPNGVWRNVMIAPSRIRGNTAAGAYFVAQDGTLIPETTDTTATPWIFSYVGTDYTLPGSPTISPKFRLRALTAPNTVVPGTNPVLALDSIGGVGGSGGNVQWTSAAQIGAVTANSFGARARWTTSEFTLTDPGDYMLTIVLSGTTAANSYVGLSFALQMRYA